MAIQNSFSKIASFSSRSKSRRSRLGRMESLEERRLMTSVEVFAVTTGVGEGEAIQIEVAVNRMVGDNQPITVKYSVYSELSDPRAASTDEYRDVSQFGGVIQFAGNDVDNRLITVNTVEDDRVEENEHFVFRLDSVEYTNINPQIAVPKFEDTWYPLTILNDDTGITIADARSVEGDTELEFAVSLTHPNALFNRPREEGVSAKFVVVPESAMAARDFESPESDELQFVRGGARVQYVRVPLINDQIPEREERLYGTLRDFDGVVLEASDIVAEGIIEDDDGGKVSRIGKLGWQDREGDKDWAVEVHNIDGKPDKHFNGGRIVTTDLGGLSEFAQKAVVQRDGKLIVGGITDSQDGEFDIALVRYNRDGSIDESFGERGIVISDLGGRDGLFGLELQTNGEIIVAATSNSAGTNDAVIIRYLPTGEIDELFGINGMTMIDLGGFETVGGVKLTWDDKIIVTGSTTSASVDTYIAQVNTNGELDFEFGDGGLAYVDLAKSELPSDILIQQDGKILVAGSVFGDSLDLSLFRVTAAGEIDFEFGDDGATIVDLGGNEFSRALAVDDNGRILLGAVSNSLDITMDSLMMRFDSNGSVDYEFGIEGVVWHPSEGSGDFMAMEIDYDGTMLSLVKDQLPGELADIVLTRFDDTNAWEFQTLDQLTMDRDTMFSDSVFIRDYCFVPGDANCDGRFDSSDLIKVFQAGKYEQGTAADWSEGDWNGDGMFDSSDLIAAMIAGGYRNR